MVLVVAAQGREAPLADGKGEEDLGARIHPHLHERKEEADPYKRPCESPRENTGKPWLMVVADLFPLVLHLGSLNGFFCFRDAPRWMLGTQRKLTEA